MIFKSKKMKMNNYNYEIFIQKTIKTNKKN